MRQAFSSLSRNKSLVFDACPDSGSAALQIRKSQGKTNFIDIIKKVLVDQINIAEQSLLEPMQFSREMSTSATGRPSTQSAAPSPRSLHSISKRRRGSIPMSGRCRHFLLLAKNPEIGEVDQQQFACTVKSSDNLQSIPLMVSVFKRGISHRLPAGIIRSIDLNF